MVASVVITTYNRKLIIRKAIDSCLASFMHANDGESEVIVVDDASTDQTTHYLKEIYSAEIAERRLKIISLVTNQGVTGAKNAGFLAATKPWVVFLDSDDTLIPTYWPQALKEFQRYLGYPIVFFRCITQNGKFVGRKFPKNVKIDLENYVEHSSYGEVLTAFNRTIITIAEPFIAELRGYEGLGCARLIDMYGPALLSSTVLRIYNLSGTDRLSNTSAFLGRMSLLAQGHMLFIKEFRDMMSMSRLCSYAVKAGVYYVVGYVYNRLKKYL